MCGEDTRPRDRRSITTGRSPRVRGRPAYGASGAVARGSIPACAGKTHSGREFVSTRPVDPRVCGEDGIHEAENVRNGGRSPRVRGRPSTSSSAAISARSIPACAGKTLGCNPMIANAKPIVKELSGLLAFRPGPARAAGKDEPVDLD